MDDDGLRDCAQLEWCASATTEEIDGQRVRVPARGPRAFCAADQGRITAALAELPRMYVQLSAALGDPVKREEMIRAGFGPRLPIRADIESLMTEYRDILHSWHERVAAVARLSPPDGGRPHVLVGRALTILSAPGRADVLLALGPEPMHRAITYRQLEELGDIDGVVRPGYVASSQELDGADAGLEILRLHRRSRAVLGETRDKPVELIGVPCRECDWRTLQRAELPSDPAKTGPWSVCTQCGAQMGEDEYREWVALTAAYERYRAEPEILESLPAAA